MIELATIANRQVISSSHHADIIIVSSIVVEIPFAILQKASKRTFPVCLGG
jgi:hypothetical protein